MIDEDILPCVSTKGNQFEKGFRTVRGMERIWGDYGYVARCVFDFGEWIAKEVFGMVCDDLCAEWLGDSVSVLRVLRYPKMDNRRKYIGVEVEDGMYDGELNGEVVADDHTDLGFITVMFCSNVPGLQV